MNNDKLNEILEYVKKFPKSSGVYLMKNSNGKVIYVGKAKILKRRVSDYFLKEQNNKTKALLSHIDSIDYIITSSEYEALILENNLIKKYKPHYNIDLKDDKTYAMIKITKEDFPQVIKTRRKILDGSLYFGPYPKSMELEIFFQLIDENFVYRRCRKLHKRATPCLYYHIGKCQGPCFRDFDKIEYRKQINKIERFLNGDSDEITKMTESKMIEFSKNEDFENAIIQRDRLNVIKKFQSIQSVGNVSDKNSIDYIGAYSHDDMVFIYIMQYRNSNLLGASSYWTQTIADEEDVFFDFIMQYYSSSSDIPDIIEFSPKYNKDLLNEYFDKNFKKVILSSYQTNKDFRILELANINAKDSYEKYLRKKNKKNQEEYSENEFEYSNLSLKSNDLIVSEKQNDADFYKFLISLSSIGEKKAKLIMENFSNIDLFLKADTDEIHKKINISKKTIDKIKNQLIL